MNLIQGIIWIIMVYLTYAQKPPIYILAGSFAVIFVGITLQILEKSAKSRRRESVEIVFALVSFIATFMLMATDQIPALAHFCIMIVTGFLGTCINIGNLVAVPFFAAAWIFKKAGESMKALSGNEIPSFRIRRAVEQ